MTPFCPRPESRKQLKKYKRKKNSKQVNLTYFPIYSSIRIKTVIVELVDRIWFREWYYLFNMYPFLLRSRNQLEWCFLFSLSFVQKGDKRLNWLIYNACVTCNNNYLQPFNCYFQLLLKVIEVMVSNDHYILVNGTYSLWAAKGEKTCHLTKVKFSFM